MVTFLHRSLHFFFIISKMRNVFRIFFKYSTRRIDITVCKSHSGTYKRLEKCFIYHVQAGLYFLYTRYCLRWSDCLVNLVPQAECESWLNHCLLWHKRSCWLFEQFMLKLWVPTTSYDYYDISSIRLTSINKINICPGTSRNG